MSSGEAERVNGRGRYLPRWDGGKGVKPLFVIYVMTIAVPGKAPVRTEHRFDGLNAPELCKIMTREALETYVRIPPGGSVTVGCSAHW